MTHSLTVGMILTSTWGYDQTNIDFFKVLKVSSTSVTIRKLQNNEVFTGHMEGKCTPSDEFHVHHKQIRRKVFNNELVKIESYAWAKPWDGQPKNFTTYA